MRAHTQCYYVNLYCKKYCYCTLLYGYFFLRRTVHVHTTYAVSLIKQSCLRKTQTLRSRHENGIETKQKLGRGGPHVSNRTQFFRQATVGRGQLLQIWGRCMAPPPPIPTPPLYICVHTYIHTYIHYYVP